MRKSVNFTYQQRNANQNHNEIPNIYAQNLIRINKCYEYNNKKTKKCQMLVRTGTTTLRVSVEHKPRQPFWKTVW